MGSEVGGSRRTLRDGPDIGAELKQLREQVRGARPQRTRTGYICQGCVVYLLSAEGCKACVTNGELEEIPRERMGDGPKQKRGFA